MDVPQDVIEKAKKVKLLLLDVDGVLTEGSLIYDSKGREIKMFNVRDGLGVFLLGQAGIPSVILTARDSRVVHIRAKEMQVKGVYQGFPKAVQLEKIAQEQKVGLDEMCFIGDDLIDIEVAKKVLLPIAVADACNELKDAAVYTTQAKGGRGAVREVVEILLKAQGLWKWPEAKSAKKE